MYSNKKRLSRPLDDDFASNSLSTQRTDHDFFSKEKKPATFYQSQLKVHYKAIAKAISDKRSYRMTDWREAMADIDAESIEPPSSNNIASDVISSTTTLLTRGSIKAGGGDA